MHEVLTSCESSYAPTLARLKEDVAAAKEECDDITLYLEPMRSHLEELEEIEFDNLPIKFSQIMHILTLVWRHSAHYATPRRFVVILREIMNQVGLALLNLLAPTTSSFTHAIIAHAHKHLVDSARSRSVGSMRSSVSLSLSLSLFSLSLSLSFLILSHHSCFPSTSLPCPDCGQPVGLHCATGSLWDGA